MKVVARNQPFNHFITIEIEGRQGFVKCRTRHVLSARDERQFRRIEQSPPFAILSKKDDVPAL